MSRASRGSCALGVLLFLLVGCSAPEFFTSFFAQSTDANGDRVIAGSLESVTQTTQGSLARLGLAAEVRPQGDTVRIVSKTSQGNGFVVVLTRVRNDKGESTRVHLEWEQGADHKTGNQILAQLDARVQH